MPNIPESTLKFGQKFFFFNINLFLFNTQLFIPVTMDVAR